MAINQKDLTTVQISKEASKMLGLIAESHMRKKGPHVEYLIRKEYAELREFKLIPEIEIEKKGKVK